MRHIPFVAILLVTVATTTSAGGQKPPLHIRDVFDLEFALSPEISPSGKWIVYTRFSSDILTDESDYRLWLTSADGTEQRPVLNGPGSAGQAEWAPGRDRFAYVVASDGPPEIRLFDPVEGDRALKRIELGFPQSLSWSRDGRYIAFMVFRTTPAPAYGDMPEKPEGAEWKDPPTFINRLSYRYPDGSIKANGYHQILVLDTISGDVRELTNASNFAAVPGSSINWTADGSHLIAEGYENVADDRYEWETNIYTIGVADLGATAITDKTSYEGQAAVSPDGRLLAYIGFHQDYPGNAAQRQDKLYVLDLETGDTRMLSGSLDRLVSDPQWAPDGTGIYAIYDDRGVTKLVRFAFDGSHEVVSDSLGSHYLAFTVGAAYSVADDGSIALTYKTPYVAGDIVVIEPGTHDRTRVTRLNDDLFSERALGEVREIDYKSARDQLDIQGWFILPPNYDASREYPLLLEVHGGPYANYGPRFDIEKQIYAAAGYVVLYVNQRGSTSYGAEFIESIYLDYPGKGVHDLKAGVETICKQIAIDTTRMYIAGGSGGGILAGAMLAEYPDLFKAAAIHYPISDWRSYMHSAAPWIEIMRAMFTTYPWSDDNSYFLRSIISRVDRVKTPTMVMIGEKDYQAPVPQAEGYYRALKWNGVDCVLVIVPDETHGIRDHPSHFAAKLAAITAWFDSHR